MTTLFTSGTINIPTGDLVIPQSAWPGAFLSATISLNRCTTPTPTIWPNVATTIDIALEVSYDGAATFLPGGGGTAQGGIALGKGSAERAQTFFTFTYSQVPTHIRGTVTVASGPLRTAVTVTAQ